MQIYPYFREHIPSARTAPFRLRRCKTDHPKALLTGQMEHWWSPERQVFGQILAKNRTQDQQLRWRKHTCLDTATRHGSGCALSATGNRLGRTPDPHRCNIIGLRPPTNRAAACTVQRGFAGGWRGSWRRDCSPPALGEGSRRFFAESRSAKVEEDVKPLSKIDFDAIYLLGSTIAYLTPKKRTRGRFKCLKIDFRSSS